MAKCDICGIEVSSLSIRTDSFGTDYAVCKSCAAKIDNKQCIKCGKQLENGMSISFMCDKCYQSRAYELSKLYDQMDDISDEQDDTNEELTDAEFDKFLTSGNSFSFEDIENSQELRALWVMFKLSAIGLANNESLSAYFSNAMALLNDHIEELRGHKCEYIIIGESKEVPTYIKDNIGIIIY